MTSATAKCRDCDRRMLVRDMKTAGDGAKFCPTCWTEALATLANLAAK